MHDLGRVPGIDEHGLSAFSNHGRVALAHIKKAKLELLAVKRKRQEQEDEGESESVEHERPRYRADVARMIGLSRDHR